MLINRRIGKQLWLYAHNGILLTNKRNQTLKRYAEGFHFYELVKEAKLVSGEKELEQILPRAGVEDLWVDWEET